MTRYTRQDVLRILRLSSRHLAAWEREKLVQPDADELYSFEHLSRLRSLREMRSTRVSARSIRASVDAMQRVAGLGNTLGESSAVRNGTSIAFRHAGALVDPITQQLAFDFDFGSPRQMSLVRTASRQAAEEQVRVQEMFLSAVQFEEDPGTLPDAVTMYEDILRLRPEHAPACINLGTIFYNRRNFERAETMYRRATEVDPGYALAFFDLGNVLDETCRLSEAIAAYRRALEIVPTYADAHYNLGLAYERKGERRSALHHWMTYLKLDPIGPWADHARSQARKILALERLVIVSRAGRTVSAR